MRRGVLVVDDDPFIRKLVATTLEDVSDFDLYEASDGIQAIEVAEREQPTIVFLDVDMPRMDGIELLKLIRNDSRLKSLPVIIVSYKDREEDRSQGLEAGADYYLTKASFHDETLLRVVADLIGGSDS